MIIVCLRHNTGEGLSIRYFDKIGLKTKERAYIVINFNKIGLKTKERAYRNYKVYCNYNNLNEINLHVLK